MLNARVVVTEAAAGQIREIASKADYANVRKALASFANTNEAHPLYDPPYRAAPSPVPCRVCSAGRYSLYYALHDRTVVVFAVEDNRANPTSRFSRIDDVELLEKAFIDAMGRRS